MKNCIRAIFFIFVFLLCGCASLVRFAVGSKGFEIPQIVAHLEPVLRDNNIAVLGKIVILNPTQSVLGLEKVDLAIKDENGLFLARDVLQWERLSVMSGEELEAPVKIVLPLATLNRDSIVVYLSTAFNYKKWRVRVPVENKVAVLHLRAIKESILKPLYVRSYNKLRTTFLGKAFLEYDFFITNPIGIDLLFEGGKVGVYTAGGTGIVKGDIPGVLFKAAQASELKGTISLGNIFDRLIGPEFFGKRPLRFEFSGKLRIPDTDLSMPVRVEFIQEIVFPSKE
jgi:hypothetical protein